jgi:acyl carrier protein
MGGTYAHVCLTDTETLPQVPQEGFAKPEGYLLPLSARHPDALRELVREMTERVDKVDPPSLLDLCRAAAVRRTHHEYRVAFAGLCADDLIREMNSWLQRASLPAKASSKRKLVAVISENENCDEESPGEEKQAASHLFQTLESWGIRPAPTVCLAKGQELLGAADSKSEGRVPELNKSGADVLDLTGQNSLACAELSSTNGSIVRGFSSSEPAILTPLRIAAQLYAIGYPIAWGKIYPGVVRQVSMPLYPWQHQVCWLESVDAGRRAAEKHDASSSQPTTPASGSLRAVLSRITGLPERDIRPDASPSDLGIDSLLTLELQEQLRRFSGKLIPVETLVQVKTVRELDMLLQSSSQDSSSRVPGAATPISNAARSYEVREAAFADYEKIAALIFRNGLGVKTRREWEHVWRNNPVYQKRQDWPLGWVVEERNQITGFLGNIPLTYHFKGREILASGLHAFALDQSHRGLGLLLLNRLLEFAPEVEYFVGSTANLNSSKVLDRLGINRIPVGDWANSAFWITNYDGFVRSAVAKRRWPGSLAGMASPALRAYDKIAKAPWPAQAHPLIRQTDFDKRFDTFWHELRESNPNCFLADRSRDALTWHFRFSLEQNNAWIVTHESNSRVLAYAVFQYQDYDEINLKRVRLIDYQALPGMGDVLPSILSWGLNECRAQGIHMFEAFGFCPEKQRIINRLAPHRRKFAAWTYFHKVASPSLQKNLQDLSVWDPSQYDGDASI